MTLPARFSPPARFADATFESYHARTSEQARACSAVQQFAEQTQKKPTWGERLRRLVGKGPAAPRGLYLVGPVGTGKTHLLAAACHALAPEVPCAFLHSSTLFRSAEHPEHFARRLAETCRVVCLDEVELDDAANEARLVLFLQTLERKGVALLATSNVRPEQFLSNQITQGRFQRFLSETFRARYAVVFVGGEDYRRTKTAPPKEDLSLERGRAWIGPPDAARAAMRTAFARDECAACWMPFGELLEAATDTAHEKLMRRLLACDSLYLDGVALSSTDDALRLLRLVDDLYTRPDAPALYLTASAPPARWFAAEGRAGLERGVAEKFSRTASRLHALCEVEAVSASAPQDAS